MTPRKLRKLSERIRSIEDRPLLSIEMMVEHWEPVEMLVIRQDALIRSYKAIIKSQAKEIAELKYREVDYERMHIRQSGHDGA